MSHRRDVHVAAERLRAADADFSACVAARGSCARELEVARVQLRGCHHVGGWRRWRTAAVSELRGCVADAKARQQQASDTVQSAWQRLREARDAYVCALVAHNAAARAAAGQRLSDTTSEGEGEGGGGGEGGSGGEGAASATSAEVVFAS